VVEEMPHAVIADRDAALDQFRQQFATGDVGLLGQPGADPLRLIGQRELALMKPDSYLINTARGGIVKESDLVHALLTNRMAGAATWSAACRVATTTSS